MLVCQSIAGRRIGLLVTLPVDQSQVRQSVGCSNVSEIYWKSEYREESCENDGMPLKTGLAALKVWNHLDESIKHLPLKKFKDKVKQNILQSSFQLVFVYLFIYLFIYLSFYLFIYLFIIFVSLYWLVFALLKLTPIFKHYLVLPGSISF